MRGPRETPVPCRYPCWVWVAEIAQHGESYDWVSCCAVVDAFFRRIVGRFTADRRTSEIATDAHDAAHWARVPEPGAKYSRRPRRVKRERRPHREVFSSTVQRGLPDWNALDKRVGLTLAIFEWIEGF